MGTRSTIALEYADGTVDQVYCHWDGYVEHNGRILFEHYSDPFKLQQLMDLGDLSSLGRNIGNAHPFSPHNSEADKIAYDAAMAEGACTFYGRDRGEEGVKAKRFSSFTAYTLEHQYEEYEYILRQVDGKAVWYVCMYEKGFVPLEGAVAAAKAREEVAA